MLETLRRNLIKILGVIIFTTILSHYASNIAMAATNLIYNGNFENPPGNSPNDTWQVYRDTEETEFIWDDSVFNGASGHSLNIVGNNAYAYLGNSIPVQPNKKYSFNAWRKAQEETIGNKKLITSIAIMQINSFGEIVHNSIIKFNKEGSFEWEQKSYSFVTSSSAVSVAMMLIMRGSGSVWYDDVSLIESDLEIPAAWSSVEAIPGLDKSTFIGFKVNLDGSQSIGEALSYQWRLISKPEGSQSELTNSSLVNSNFVPDVVGDYTIGLTVSDGQTTSHERTITVRAKRMNDMSDDMTYHQFSDSTCISGYMVSDFIPLADGWVILGDMNSNKIIIMNGITGEIAKEYNLNYSPRDIDCDFDNNLILVTQGTYIAKIDVLKDTISYIAVSGPVKMVTMGEKNQLFAYVASGGVISGNNYISLIDLENNNELKSYNLYNSFFVHNLECMKYDKVYHNLFIAEYNSTPSYLYRYTYDMQNQLLNYTEVDRYSGTNGHDLAVSSDGLHLAFACGAGNGGGYTVFDYDTLNISENNGFWDTNAYPWSVDFSLDNRYIVATNTTETMLFDVDSHTLIRDICSRHDGYENTDRVRISRGNGIVYSCNKDGLHDNYFSCGSKIYLDKSGINSSIDPVVIHSVSGDKSGPVALNDVINISVDAVGGTSRQYGFLLYDGDTWTTLNPFSDNNSYTWKPLKPGTYTIVAEVRDMKSSNDYDACYVMHYEVYGPVNEPISDISSGDVPAGTSISLSSATTGAAIYYTLDSSTPTKSSTLYTAPIIVENEVTIKAIAIRDNTNSTISTFHYTIAPKVAEPETDQPAGAVTAGTQITLSSSTPSATIYYTTNGSTPSRSSSVYKNPITINNSITIKAIAVKTGVTDSTVMEISYTIKGKAAMPLADPDSGSVDNGAEISLTTTTVGATIYYTLDGTTPSKTSSTYTKPIKITSATTIKAISVKAGMTDSAVMNVSYTIKEKVNAPVANPAFGNVASGTEVMLVTSTAGAKIYYTLDASTPTSGSSLYTAPIKITSDITIKAIAIKTGLTDSSVMSASYTIKEQVNTPTANPASGSVASGTEVSLVTSTAGAKIYYTLDGSIPTSGSSLYTAPIRITSDTTIKALAIKSGMNDSNILSVAYKITTSNGSGGQTGPTGPTGPIGPIDPVGPSKLTQDELVITGVPEAITYGDKPFSISVSGGSGTGSMSLSVTSGNSVSLSGNTVTVLSAGTSTITATKAEDDKYNSISVNINITVDKAATIIETLPTVKGIAKAGVILSTLELNNGKANVPGTFRWDSPKSVLRKTGYYSITFVPSDNDNYLTAAIYNGEDTKILVTVVKQPKVISFRKDSKVIALDQTYQQEAIVDEGKDDVKITYTSNEPGIVKVDSEGLVTPKKEGAAIITATTDNGLTATYKIVVKKVPVKITINKTNMTLDIGKKVTLKPSVGEDYYTTYTFESSNNKVVTVSKYGKITAKSTGTSIITIKTHNGIAITCTVNVKNKK